MTNDAFLNKVTAERAVLRLVNAKTPGRSQLAGLSWLAIETWQVRSQLKAAPEIAGELRALSDLCQRLSDRSHETFEPLDPGLSDEIASRLKVLEANLAKI